VIGKYVTVARFTADPSQKYYTDWAGTPPAPPAGAASCPCIGTTAPSAKA
jgi:hypothetical protein